MFRIGRIFQPCFFPKNVSTENKSDIKSYGKLILLLSRRLYPRYPLYHPRIAIKEAIKMFSYFRQSVLHMCYATPTILCFISSKKNIFFCIFRDNVMEYICQLSYKLGRRIEIKLAVLPETLAGMRNQ